MKPSIITYPNEKLRNNVKAVTSFDEKLNHEIDLMTEALRAEGGIGLAANQIGFDKKIVIAEFDDPDKKDIIPFSVFINPEIIEMSDEKACYEEGCLSVPKIELETVRSAKIKVKYQNTKGQIVKFAPQGLLARILQHETDHLNGIIFTDRVKEQFYIDNPEFKKIKILFTGSGDYAAIVLKGLILLGLNLTIVTETAKLSGRGELKPTPVAEIAKKFGKKVIETNNIPDLNLKPETYNLLICSDFGQKIPETILNMVKIPINIHPSLLPKYRGSTPIQTAILNGDKETGVSLIRMTNTIDQGLILAQIKMELDEDYDALSLKERLATLGLKLLVKALPKIYRGELEGKVQNEAKVVKTRKFTKEDGLIDWTKTPVEIDRQIRAFYPWPGSFTLVNDKRLIVHIAHLEPSDSSSSTLTPQPMPAGRQALTLVLDVVQPEGKKPMLFTDFLRGLQGKKPDWLNKVKI